MMFSTSYVNRDKLNARVQQITGVADRFLPRIKVKVMFEYKPETVPTVSTGGKTREWRLSILQHRFVASVGDMQMVDSGTMYDHVQPYFGKEYEYTVSISRSAIQSIEEKRRDDVTLSLNLSGICLEGDGVDKGELHTFLINLAYNLSQTQWTKLLKDVGYQDTWIFEVVKPIVANAKFGEVSRFLQEAEAELSSGSPDDVVAKCRRALDSLDTALDADGWIKVNGEIDRGSLGEEGYPTKSARIAAIRKKVDELSNIGPHSDRYVVRYDDARLCYLLTASIASYLSRMSSRAP